MAKFDFVQYLLVSLGAGAALWFLRTEMGTNVWKSITDAIHGAIAAQVTNVTALAAIDSFTQGLIVVAVGYILAVNLKK